MSDQPANAIKTQRRGGWQKGQSGNPAGMKPGTRHKATRIAYALLDGDVDGITRKCIDAALAGEPVAMKICMDRIAPLRKGAPVAFDLAPAEFKTAANLSRHLEAVLQATAGGVLTTDEALQIAQIIEVKRRSIETADLEARIIALEGGPPLLKAPTIDHEPKTGGK